MDPPLAKSQLLMSRYVASNTSTVLPTCSADTGFTTWTGVYWESQRALKGHFGVIKITSIFSEKLPLSIYLLLQTIIEIELDQWTERQT